MTHALSLAPAALPYDAFRTVLRMFAALAASFVFSLAYATAAAKNERARRVLIPVLDVLQSVPVLGYLSFTLAAWTALARGSAAGPELAAVFAIFTSQAWNMTFSFYQSLRTVPHDLQDVCSAFGFSAWQRFWRLEVPFAVPGLIWNAMMSLSGGWFFIVAAEAISVGDAHFMLPGIGSYVAVAVEARDAGAVLWAIGTMAAVILLYDRLLFRPLVAWSAKFRVESVAGERPVADPVLAVLRRVPAARACTNAAAGWMQALVRKPFRLRVPDGVRTFEAFASRLAVVVTATAAALAVAWFAGWLARANMSWPDLRDVVTGGAITALRVAVLVAASSAVWVPVAIVAGSHPRVAASCEAIAQFAAAFPVNLCYPLAVVAIVHWHLDPIIWVTPLMALGAQWYILFNVIAGATAFPQDLREAARSFRIRGVRWWRDVMLPGTLPFYVTGAITASGGAWNASIVAELVSWGTTRIDGGGLGAYIARMTAAGDAPRVALGVAMMSLLVLCANRFIWQPLYAFAERRVCL